MNESITKSEFEKIVYENQRLITSVCRVYCANDLDQEDLFQDIVINLWNGIPNFRGDSKISTWIYRVSINTAISRVRKSKRNKFVNLDEIKELKSIDQISQTEKKYQIKALHKAIEQLNPIEKGIILLYLEENSYEEIANVIGISVKNVSVKIVRIKKKLEKLIKSISD